MTQDDFIPRSNIIRFEQKLKAATDERERKVLRELLAAERRMLDAVRRPKI
ncbi:MAG TPA: hypothetical protein VLM36_09285 [Sphingomicrobium sp.]|nr:hypothetical protein [Sphingomicrobium sp.]